MTNKTKEKKKAVKNPMLLGFPNDYVNKRGIPKAKFIVQHHL